MVITTSKQNLGVYRERPRFIGYILKCIGPQLSEVSSSFIRYSSLCVSSVLPFASTVLQIQTHTDTLTHRYTHLKNCTSSVEGDYTYVCVCVFQCVLVCVCVCMLLTHPFVFYLAVFDCVILNIGITFNNTA